MQRLNRNAAKNLFVGQRVETDYAPGVFVIDALIKSEPSQPYMDGLGAVASPAHDVCKTCGAALPPAEKINPGFAAAWFWPEGVLEFVRENAGRKE